MMELVVELFGVASPAWFGRMNVQCRGWFTGVATVPLIPHGVGTGAASGLTDSRAAMIGIGLRRNILDMFSHAPLRERRRFRAMWGPAVLTESERVQIVAGNVYFHPVSPHGIPDPNLVAARMPVDSDCVLLRC